MIIVVVTVFVVVFIIKVVVFRLQQEQLHMQLHETAAMRPH